MNVNSKSKVVLFVLVALLVVLAMVPLPVHAAQAGASPGVLDLIMKVALGFASLVGAAKLNAVIVQVLKFVGLVKDATASQWTAGLNLLLFFVLVYFGVFQPQLAFEVLDGYAAQLSEIALFVFGFVVQMTGSKPTYDQLKASRLPVLSYSYSSAK